MITQPPDGKYFQNGTSITFSATGYPTGISTITSYSWDDDVNGATLHLGDSPTIAIALSGALCSFVHHHVTVTVTDDLGRTATAAVDVYVGSLC